DHSSPRLRRGQRGPMRFAWLTVLTQVLERYGPQSFFRLVACFASVGVVNPFARANGWARYLCSRSLSVLSGLFTLGNHRPVPWQSSMVIAPPDAGRHSHPVRDWRQYERPLDRHGLDCDVRPDRTVMRLGAGLVGLLGLLPGVAGGSPLAYVSGGDALVVIDTANPRRGTRSRPPPCATPVFGVHPVGTSVYVAMRTAQVAVVDAASRTVIGLVPIPLPGPPPSPPPVSVLMIPRQVLVHPNGTTAYVSGI